MVTHMPKNNTDVLLTSPQAAHRIGVSHRTVHRLAATGKLAPAQKLPGPNGAFLFSARDVEKFIARSKKAA